MPATRAVPAGTVFAARRGMRNFSTIALACGLGALLSAAGCTQRWLDRSGGPIEYDLGDRPAGVQDYARPRHGGVVISGTELAVELVVAPGGEARVYVADNEPRGGASAGSPLGVISMRAVDGAVSSATLRWDPNVSASVASLPAPGGPSTYELDVRAGTRRLRGGAAISAGGTAPTAAALRAEGDTPGDPSPPVHAAVEPRLRRRAVGGGPSVVVVSDDASGMDAGRP